MNRLSRNILCLDWDRRHLRILVARRELRGATLEAAHREALPPEVKPDDAEAMGDFIASKLRAHKIKLKQVLVDIPRDKAVINRLSIAPTPDRELPDVVRLQALRELPFSVDDAEIDHVVLARDDKNLATEVLLVAVLKKSLEKIIETCRRAGLTPARIGLRPYANLSAVRALSTHEPMNMLFVDVGAYMSEINIFHEGRLGFSRAANVEMPTPGGHLTVSEDSKILSARDLESPEGRIDHAVDKLVVEMTRSLQAFRATEPGVKINHVIIAGGVGIAANIEHRLREVATERLGIPCDLFNPTRALGVDARTGDMLRAFSAALGLAWGLSRTGKLELDFLNPKRPIPRGQVQKQRIRTGVLAAATVVVALGAFYFVKYQKGARELQAVQEQIAALREDVKARLKIKQQIDRIEEWNQGAVWPEELLALTDAAVDPGKKMIVKQVRLDNRAAKIDVKQLQADTFDVPSTFVDQLTKVEEDGGKKYALKANTWREGGLSSNRKFEGTIDIDIWLRELKDFYDNAGIREKDRKKALRDF
ncbi:MAG: pilus assembly protein PilM [Phycisphaerae bacterium]